MKNEYGVQLDRNGYATSILQDKEECYITGMIAGKLDRHEVFHGPFRAKSKRLGLWVLLDHEVHMALHSKYPELDQQLKATAQKEAMAHYGWEASDFITVFGKNYL